MAYVALINENNVVIRTWKNKTKAVVETEFPDPSKLIESEDEIVASMVFENGSFSKVDRVALAIPDVQFIEDGVAVISAAIGAAYTYDVWKSAAYQAKKIEAEYISATQVADIEQAKCEILTSEAADLGITLKQMAAVIIGKVQAYEQLVINGRRARDAIAVAVVAADTQVAKLAAKDAIVANFIAALAV